MNEVVINGGKKDRNVFLVASSLFPRGIVAKQFNLWIILELSHACYLPTLP